MRVSRLRLIVQISAGRILLAARQFEADFDGAAEAKKTLASIGG
jgi:hypothetical protein